VRKRLGWLCKRAANSNDESANATPRRPRINPILWWTSGARYYLDYQNGADFIQALATITSLGFREFVPQVEAWFQRKKQKRESLPPFLFPNRGFPPFPQDAASRWIPRALNMSHF